MSRQRTRSLLAEGQAQIAREVSEKVAAQCEQTGADAAAEVRSAGTGQIEGFDAHADACRQTLQDGLQSTLQALETTRSEAVTAIKKDAQTTSAEVDTQLAQGLAGLDQKESTLLDWLQAQVADVPTMEKAEEWAGALGLAFIDLAASFDAAANDVEAAIAGVEEPDAESLAEVNAEVDTELARLWELHANPLFEEEQRLLQLIEEQVGDVENGIATAIAEVQTNLTTDADSAIQGIVTFAGQFMGLASRIAVEANSVTGLPNIGLKGPKTTLLDLAGKWPTIKADLITELDNLIRGKTFPINPGSGPPVSGVAGQTWNFFFRNGEIATIYPI